MAFNNWSKVVNGAFLTLAVAPAYAFDTGIHFDITRNAMSLEGFGHTPIQVVQVSNWFNDLYEQDTSNSYSGHVSWFGSFENFVGNLLTLFRKEDWPDSIVKAAEKMHFDSSCPINTTAQADAEWTRLARATKSLIRQCAANNDREGILCVMGMSLHAVQDFYTHSNWVEPRGDRVLRGYSGPGWAATGKYGSHPTWFDVPATDRNKEAIYSQVLGNPGVGHGDWNSQNSGTGPLAMNKDSAGRPLNGEAVVTAIFASRQWIQAMRTWLGNEPMWAALRAFSNTHGGDLSHDQTGAFNLSWRVGHWNGNVDLKSSKPDIIRAGISYFEGRSKTAFRRKWEDLVRPLMALNPAVSETPVPRSTAIVAGVDVIQVSINRLSQIDDIDGGDVPYITENDADWFVKSIIDGQVATSCLIDGHNSFTFPNPYGNIRFIKAVPKQRQNIQPLSLLKVRLRTGTGSGAGSDMDLFLRFGARRMEFPYGDFDDFENGRNDLYTFPVPAGYTMRDLSSLALEKRGGGPWQMGGIEVFANGLSIYANNAVNRWFNASNETFALPSFRVPEYTTRDVPIYLDLWDDDWGITGSDDQADICPGKGSKTLRLLFNPQTLDFTGDVVGRGPTTIRGAGDSDRAEIRFFLSTHKTIAPPGRFTLRPGIRDSVLTPTGGVKPPPGGGVRPPGGTIRPPKRGKRPPIKPPGGGDKPPGR